MEPSESKVDFDSMRAVFRERDSDNAQKAKDQKGKAGADASEKKAKKEGKESHEELAAAAHLQAVIGDYGGAVELLQQCVRMKPEILEYKYNLELNLGKKYKKAGNKGRAEQHFQNAVKIAPKGNKAAANALASLQGGSGPESGGDTGIGGAFGRLFRGKKS
jgi:tetratricopeptide (TPR) repeat protein